MANIKKLYPLAYAVANKYGKLAVASIKDILIKEGKVASGTLVDSVGYRIQEGPVDGDEIELVIFWVDYGDYVDRGRPEGIMPPVSKIEQWVKLRGIQGRNKKGKFQSSEQTAWAIAKGIEKNGIEPTFFKTLTERNILATYPEEFIKAITQDITNTLNNIKLR